MISASGTGCSDEVVVLNGDQHGQVHYQYQVISVNFFSFSIIDAVHLNLKLTD